MSERVAAISVSGVTRRFAKTPAIANLSLDVWRGEIFALVGPDGAGKTTLIRLICGALKADSGSIIVDGVDVAHETAVVQSSVGYMPQRFSLYPDLTVRENLRFYGDLYSMASADFSAHAEQLLDDFALSPFAARRADELSGGMKQKLALACALIHKPATMLLDEPTAGVDPVSRRAFWRILYGINRSGTTIFVSTPYMDEAERAARVAFISHGSILTCGTPAELKSALQGEVVEVLCAQRAVARRALRGEPQIRSIEVFGETLHALVSSAAEAIPAIQQRLSAAGLAAANLKKISPSLEDAFVARLTA